MQKGDETSLTVFIAESLAIKALENVPLLPSMKPSQDFYHAVLGEGANLSSQQKTSKQNLKQTLPSRPLRQKFSAFDSIITSNAESIDSRSSSIQNSKAEPRNNFGSSFAVADKSPTNKLNLEFKENKDPVPSSYSKQASSKTSAKKYEAQQTQPLAKRRSPNQVIKLPTKYSSTNSKSRRSSESTSKLAELGRTKFNGQEEKAVQITNNPIFDENCEIENQMQPLKYKNVLTLEKWNNGEKDKSECGPPYFSSKGYLGMLSKDQAQDIKGNKKTTQDVNSNKLDTPSHFTSNTSLLYSKQALKLLNSPRPRITAEHKYGLLSGKMSREDSAVLSFSPGLSESPNFSSQTMTSPTFTSSTISSLPTQYSLSSSCVRECEAMLRKDDNLSLKPPEYFDDPKSSSTEDVSSKQIQARKDFHLSSEDPERKQINNAQRPITSPSDLGSVFSSNFNNTSETWSSKMFSLKSESPNSSKIVSLPRETAQSKNTQNLVTKPENPCQDLLHEGPFLFLETTSQPSSSKVSRVLEAVSGPESQSQKPQDDPVRGKGSISVRQSSEVVNKWFQNLADSQSPEKLKPKHFESPMPKPLFPPGYLLPETNAPRRRDPVRKMQVAQNPPEDSRKPENPDSKPVDTKKNILSPGKRILEQLSHFPSKLDKKMKAILRSVKQTGRASQSVPQEEQRSTSEQTPRSQDDTQPSGPQPDTSSAPVTQKSSESGQDPLPTHTFLSSFFSASLP